MIIECLKNASARSILYASRSELGSIVIPGSDRSPSAVTLTEDAKTEKYTAGSPCGAYIENPCKFEDCRAFVLYHFNHSNLIDISRKRSIISYTYHT